MNPGCVAAKLWRQFGYALQVCLSPKGLGPVGTGMRSEMRWAEGICTFPLHDVLATFWACVGKRGWPKPEQAMLSLSGGWAVDGCISNKCHRTTNLNITEFCDTRKPATGFGYLRRHSLSLVHASLRKTSCCHSLGASSLVC